MNSRGFVFLTLMIAAIIFSGCSPKYSTIISKYEQATVCCRNVKDFTYEPINNGESIKFELDETYPAFMFDTGKSFFKPFSMPEYNRPYRISISSYVQGQYIELAHIFIPRIIFLNEKHEITRVADASTFTTRKTPISETSGLRFKVQGDINVSHNNKDEKYFIIMTSKEYLKGKTRFSMMQTIPLVIVPGSVIPFPSGEKDVLIPNSPFGKIKVELN